MKKYPEYKQLDLSAINKEVLAKWRSNLIFEKKSFYKGRR